MAVKTWLATSLVRQFPLGKPGGRKTLIVRVARGSRVSFQAGIRVTGDWPVTVAASASAPAGLSVRVRRVGRVPMPHHNTRTPKGELDGIGLIPGYVPDPLFDENTATAVPGEITAFWFTVKVARDARPGEKKVRVRLTVDGTKLPEMTATVFVSKVVVPKRKDFHVTHWFYADALCDWYKLEPFEESFWPVCRKYMRDVAEHGQDTLYVPVFTPPLDGVKRPTQLLGVKRLAGGRYRFDWRKVHRWIAEARRAGLTHFEWTHLFTQWGVEHAIRVYEDPSTERLLWPPATGATSRTYRNFLSQFLPALERFLTRERLVNRSFFHVSDEPHGDAHRENYRKARAMLHELAPWMKVMDALSEIAFAREGLVDMPIPSIRVTKRFWKEKIPSWTYFCCGPRGKYLNRLFDTPLAKIRMSGWLFYRFRVLGFLHWGYNYWYKSQTREMIDPFTVSDGLKWPGWSHGDTFLVYPGPAGPIDSIRWEVFAESLQDYAILEGLGVDPDGKMLSSLQDFDRFPKDEAWHTRAMKKLLEGRTR